MRYGIYTTSNRFSFINIDNIGISDEISVTKYGPGNRTEYIIFYVLKGKGYFNNNPVVKGQGFIHNIDAFEEYYADENDPWTLLWFVSGDRTMGTVIKDFNADKNTFIFDCDLTPTLPSLMETLEKHNKNKYNRAEMLEIFMSVFKLTLASRNEDKLTKTEYSYMNRATEYIYHNYHKKLTVEAVAKYTGIGQTHLFNIFKKHFNKSPKQYITDIRIEKAKKLLDETSLSIYNVANAVGYPDYFAFAKVFSQKTGSSAKKYRARFYDRRNMKTSGK